MKYEWKEGENHKIKAKPMQKFNRRVEIKVYPRFAGKKKKNTKLYRSKLSYFRQTSETFKDFWTELKRKFYLKKAALSNMKNIKTVEYTSSNTSQKS